MKSIVRLCAFVGTTLLLGGCATMNESECLNADWQVIGLADGAAGRLPSYIQKHQSACAKHNVTPDLVAYRQGHAEGLHEYCTNENGFRIGRSGAGYNGVCPEDLAQPFLDGYDVGREFYVAVSAINETEATIRSHKKQLDRINVEIQEKEDQIKSGERPEDVGRLLAEIKDDSKTVSEYEQELKDLYQVLGAQKYQYEQLQAQFGY